MKKKAVPLRAEHYLWDGAAPDVDKSGAAGEVTVKPRPERVGLTKELAGCLLHFVAGGK